MSENDSRLRMRPVPETREAFDWLGAYGDWHLEESVQQMADRVREIVPECVALSLTMREGDLTFTLTTDKPGALLLDAMQYLAGGPCEAAVLEGSTRVTPRPPTDEGEWQLFARAEGLAGVASTLSLPVVEGTETIGGVNLYAVAPDAFEGRVEEVAAACSAWARGAVRNADLSFTSRVRASATPSRLRQGGLMDTATGYVAAHQDLGLTEALDRIQEAARHAGVSEAELARFILDSHGARHGDAGGVSDGG